MISASEQGTLHSFFLKVSIASALYNTGKRGAHNQSHSLLLSDSAARFSLTYGPHWPRLRESSWFHLSLDATAALAWNRDSALRKFREVATVTFTSVEWFSCKVQWTNGPHWPRLVSPMVHLPLDATAAFLETVTVPEVFGGVGRVARWKTHNRKNPRAANDPSSPHLANISTHECLSLYSTKTITINI